MANDKIRDLTEFSKHEIFCSFYTAVSYKALLYYLLLCKKCDNNHDTDTKKLRLLTKIKVYLDYNKQNCFLTYKNEKVKRSEVF